MIIRYAFSLGSGTLVTLALFYAMQALIELQPGVVQEPRDRAVLGDWLRLIPEEELLVDDFVPPPKDFIEPPLPPETRPPVPEGDGLPVPPDPGPGTPPGPEPWVPGAQIDSLLVSVMKVAPQYPADLAARDVEGYVIVRFDVTETGTVTNIRVEASSHRGFEKAAMRAAARFRYQPKIVDGVAIPVKGLRNRFVFRMERV
jgi:protein TonB